MIAGGLHKAIATGQDVGCDVVQVFTKSPQQWQARPLASADIVAFRDAQQASGIPCVAAHDTYLINPAAALQQRGGERPRPQLGDPQLQIPRRRAQQLGPMPVALGQPVGRSLIGAAPITCVARPR